MITVLSTAEQSKSSVITRALGKYIHSQFTHLGSFSFHLRRLAGIEKEELSAQSCVCTGQFSFKRFDKEDRQSKKKSETQEAHVEEKIVKRTKK